jgi:2,3-dihydroxybenzoate decarboxylase
MRCIALEEAFSIPEEDGRQQLPWPVNRFRRRSLADWARRFPDFTEFRLPEMDAAGIDVQVLSLSVPGLQTARMRRPRGPMPGWPITTWHRS